MITSHYQYILAFDRILGFKYMFKPLNDKSILTLLFTCTINPLTVPCSLFVFFQLVLHHSPPVCHFPTHSVFPQREGGLGGVNKRWGRTAPLTSRQEVSSTIMFTVKKTPKYFNPPSVFQFKPTGN